MLSGAPNSFQLGNNSSSARVSKTAPDRMWAPTSEPFSTTHTLISWPASAAFYLSRHAAERPDGPAPTMTTSNSINSRSTSYLLHTLFIVLFLRREFFTCIVIVFVHYIYHDAVFQCKRAFEFFLSLLEYSKTAYWKWSVRVLIHLDVTFKITKDVYLLDELVIYSS